MHFMRLPADDSFEMDQTTHLGAVWLALRNLSARRSVLAEDVSPHAIAT